MPNAKQGENPDIFTYLRDITVIFKKKRETRYSLPCLNYVFCLLHQLV
jgi:hypothetical protein